MVERTRALRSLTLAGISNSEYFVYLREAAQCYVSGLPQAAIALSRAAVENRLREVCARQFGSRAVENTDLKDLIDDIATRGKVLSKEGRQLAHLVRQAGNDVLHDEPTTSNALQVVEAARDVIKLLHGR
jgi:polyhydroxyalkanoate synthesis regulator phasin